jgi:glycosyltransferase involved in cell wall biosynthesis
MNKIVEYMAMRLPVVAFDLVEARVSAAEAGVYAPANDVREFGRLISELLDDPGRRRDMGERGRARVEAELSWATSRQHLIDAYRRLLRAEPPSESK